MISDIRTFIQKMCSFYGYIIYIFKQGMNGVKDSIYNGTCRRSVTVGFSEHTCYTSCNVIDVGGKTDVHYKIKKRCNTVETGGKI